VLSYGGIPLQVPSAATASWIESNIPLRDAFGFFRPKSLGIDSLNPRAHFAWALSRPLKINCLFQPWGASRWGYAFVVADSDMHDSILALNTDGSALPFILDDGLGGAITTPMLMPPPIPVTKILKVTPALPLFILPLIDERYRWWEVASEINVVEGTTTWTALYADIATALGIVLTVDPISADYLAPGAGLGKSFQALPLLLDWCAASVGQRIVRTLDGSFFARNAMTGTTLQIAQANANRKYAGGSFDLGLVNA